MSANAGNLSDADVFTNFFSLLMDNNEESVCRNRNCQYCKVWMFLLLGWFMFKCQTLAAMSNQNKLLISFNRQVNQLS